MNSHRFHVLCFAVSWLLTFVKLQVEVPASAPSLAGKHACPTNDIGYTISVPPLFLFCPWHLLRSNTSYTLRLTFRRSHPPICDSTSSTPPLSRKKAQTHPAPFYTSVEATNTPSQIHIQPIRHSRSIPQYTQPPSSPLSSSTSIFLFTTLKRSFGVSG